jgi:hypothetical protein
MKKTLILVGTFALAAAMSAFAQQDATPQSAPTANNPTTTSPNSDQSSTSQGSTSSGSSMSQGSSASQNDTSSQGSSASQSGSSMSHDSAAAQSYTGTVTKGSDGKYVLKTDTGSYQIDDQDKAKQYEGKQVKVNGTLDSATSMLHVTDISPMS